MGLPDSPRTPLALGWREWVRLPALGIPAVRAKLDTGARSSALHVVRFEPFQRDGRAWVRFVVDPDPDAPDRLVEAETRLHDERLVRASSGHEELRAVIRTMLEIDGRAWEIDVTLARREMMRFRMLIGREALRGRVVVDPARSYVAPHPTGDRRWRERSGLGAGEEE